MTKFPVLLVASLFAAVIPLAKATEDITQMASTGATGTWSSAEGYTFENNQRPVTTFSTATNNYIAIGLANNVFVRRNGVNANQSSIWYASSGTGTNLAGTHYDNYGPMLLANNLYEGSDNTFANGSSGATIGNIERLDFTWNSPLTVSNGLAFAVFDRGAVGVHDSFSIAAITAVDALGNPTAFGALLTVAPGWGGATNPIADQTYRQFRYSNGDIVNVAVDSSEIGTQGVGGVVVRAIDLGIVSGMQIYGYSLMAADVTAATSNQLLDWTDSTYYPTTTNGATGGGGIDLAAANGMAFIVVPEPATWVLFIVGSGWMGWSMLQRKKNAHA